MGKRLLKVLFIMGWIPFIIYVAGILMAILTNSSEYDIYVLVLIFISLWIFILSIIQYVIYGYFSPFYLFKKESLNSQEENSDD